MFEMIEMFCMAYTLCNSLQNMSQTNKLFILKILQIFRNQVFGETLDCRYKSNTQLISLK